MPVVASGNEILGTVKKPRWWSGSWIFKSVLVLFGAFLIWLPVYSEWPTSIAAQALAMIFALCALPLFFVCVGGRILGVLMLPFVLFTLTKNLFCRSHNRKAGPS